MSNCIFINDLTIETIIGILPDERITKQPIVLNLKCYFDFSAACESDDFNDTIDYAHIVEQLKHFVGHSSFELIEKLAEQICQFLFNAYAIETIHCHLTKPNAINDANVGVIIERKRNKTTNT